ncbi:MAG: hypothetical protein CSA70_03800 [Rhodobacterales bacterium]|nr:MAG: hypothetical protein CSA70_03800 [Rhodobacterales bacterium]
MTASTHLRFIALVLTLAFALALTPMVRAGDMQLVLKLEQVVDGKAVRNLSLYATRIDPNTRASGDRLHLEIDGKRVQVPDALLQRLNHARREYSYDTFTNGIHNTERRSMCMMAGPAVGDVLSVRYLTWKNHKITHSEMKPVLSLPGNCLFAEQIRPESDASMIAATHALATLQTLRDMR